MVETTALCSGKHNPSFIGQGFVIEQYICHVLLDCPKAGEMFKVDRLAKFHIYPGLF